MGRKKKESQKILMGEKKKKKKKNIIRQNLNNREIGRGSTEQFNKP